MQEVWDVAKKISCKYSESKRGDNQGKMVVFKPLTVGMLDVMSQPLQSSDGLDCWMDIQKGRYPNVSFRFNLIYFRIY